MEANVSEDRYGIYQTADQVAVIDRTIPPEGGQAVIALSRVLGNPRTRLLALELADRLNHEDEGRS